MTHWQIGQQMDKLAQVSNGSSNTFSFSFSRSLSLSLSGN